MFSMNRFADEDQGKFLSPLRGLTFIPNLSQRLHAGLTSHRASSADRSYRASGADRFSPQPVSNPLSEWYWANGIGANVMPQNFNGTILMRVHNFRPPDLHPTSECLNFYMSAPKSWFGPKLPTHFGKSIKCKEALGKLH
jgi:hypothetical protein